MTYYVSSGTLNPTHSLTHINLFWSQSFDRAVFILCLHMSNHRIANLGFLIIRV